MSDGAGIAALVEGERQRMRDEGLEPAVLVVNPLVASQVPPMEGIEVIEIPDCPPESAYLMTQDTYDEVYEKSLEEGDSEDESV